MKGEQTLYFFQEVPIQPALIVHIFRAGLVYSCPCTTVVKHCLNRSCQILQRAKQRGSSPGRFNSISFNEKFFLFKVCQSCGFAVNCLRDGSGVHSEKKKKLK